jgi:hypothetical protein
VAGALPATRDCSTGPIRTSYAESDSHVSRYAVNRGLLLDGMPRLGLTFGRRRGVGHAGLARGRGLTLPALLYSRTVTLSYALGDHLRCGEWQRRRLP